jgi:DeoR/GlpR family transcriptional regulator of sugar metabolism
MTRKNSPSPTARLQMVEQCQVIILDSGTTIAAIARALRSFQNLTIISKGFNIAAEEAGTAFEVILTGHCV